MSKFKPGDRVITIKSNSGLYKVHQTGTVVRTYYDGEMVVVEMDELDSLKFKKPHITENRLELLEVYNSPLYKALT